MFVYFSRSCLDFDCSANNDVNTNTINFQRNSSDELQLPNTTCIYAHLPFQLRHNTSASDASTHDVTRTCCTQARVLDSQGQIIPCPRPTGCNACAAESVLYDVTARGATGNSTVHGACGACTSMYGTCDLRRS